MFVYGTIAAEKESCESKFTGDGKRVEMKIALASCWIFHFKRISF